MSTARARLAILGLAAAAFGFAVFQLTRPDPSPVRVDQAVLRQTNERLGIVRTELEALPDLGQSAILTEGCVYDDKAFDADRLRQPTIRRVFMIGESDDGTVDRQIGQALLARGWEGDGEPDHGFEIYSFNRDNWTATAAVDAGTVRVSIDKAMPCKARY